METSEVMQNDEVTTIVEEVEENVMEQPRKNAKVAMGIGLAAVAGVAAYRYVIKPMLKKLKDKKDCEDTSGDFFDGEIVDVNEAEKLDDEE